MEQAASPIPLLAGTSLAFTPVAQQRHRADGWTPDTQANFIRALEAMGSVGRAAKAVGMGRRSAYRLRERPGADSFAESLSYFPAGADSDTGAHRYLSLLERAAKTVDIPVIASLNGVTRGGWTYYARAMQDAGAAAIEVNIYYIASNPHLTGQEVEQRHVDILEQVKDVVSVPVAVKLGPQFSSPGEIAVRLDKAGADGLVQATVTEPAPTIIFPPDGARVDLGTNSADASPLVLKLQGGRAPFRWLANGKPLTGIDRRRTATWLPDGAGYSTLTVIDAAGRAASVKVFVE